MEIYNDAGKDILKCKSGCIEAKFDFGDVVKHATTGNVGEVVGIACFVDLETMYKVKGDGFDPELWWQESETFAAVD